MCELHVNCTVRKPSNCDSQPTEGKIDALLQEQKNSMENSNDINEVKRQLEIYATYVSIKELMSPKEFFKKLLKIETQRANVVIYPHQTHTN